MKAKPLLVLLFFVLFIALFASRAIGNTDLTPDTPPAPTSVMFDAFLSGSGGAVTGQPCGGAYTVRSGDTLTRISQICGVPLANLLAANPNIHDPHRISVGQVIQIYYAPAPANPVAQPPATATAAPAAAQPEPRSAGLRPGGTLHVILKDLPPSSPVLIGIGKEGDDSPLPVADGITDAQGELSLSLAIPETANPGEHWVVTITSSSRPEMEVNSAPFEIEE